MNNNIKEFAMTKLLLYMDILRNLSRFICVRWRRPPINIWVKFSIGKL